MKRSNDALHYSLAEFAYLLFFLSTAVTLAVYGQYRAARSQVISLQAEVNYLNEVLAEKENAVVPCWRRPDAVIPEVIGIITIHSPGRYSLTRLPDGEEEAFAAAPEKRDEVLLTQIGTFFAAERAYAREKNCYIRVRIENLTNDFAVYKGLAEQLARLGVVVVND